MRSTSGYKFAQKQNQPQRPIGVAVFAIIGVVSNLATILICLVGLLIELRMGAAPSIQPLALGGSLTLALISLWINWGLWELIRWAWWASLLTSLLVISALVTSLRFLQPLAAIATKLRPALSTPQALTQMLAALIIFLAFQVMIVLYLLSVRAVFGVGVSQDRPLWERVHRH